MRRGRLASLSTAQPLGAQRNPNAGLNQLQVQKGLTKAQSAFSQVSLQAFSMTYSLCARGEL